MLKINDIVKYSYIKPGIIEQVHYDNAPDIYYTIKITSKKNHYPQTTKNNLQLVKKIGTLEPFDKNDKIIYTKIITTKIYDIILSKNNTKLYKILFNDKFILVKDKYLT
tara:strand:- start:232 stop:558 length:327 start_codon:yes stop_codon:yes gene_type:complete